MKITGSFKPLFICALTFAGSFTSSAQNLYRLPVYSEPTEVRVINESTNRIRWLVPNSEGDGFSQPFGFLTYGLIPPNESDPYFHNYFGWADPNDHYFRTFTTAAGQTASSYPTRWQMMLQLENGGPLVSLADLLGIADHLWWSVLFYKVDEYDNSVALDGVGFEDLSFADVSGMHIVYRFYDLEE